MAKKDKRKFGRLAFFLSYISRGVIQKDKPQDAERGASNETTAMAENQNRLILGSPYLILDEPGKWRFLYCLMVLLEGYAGTINDNGYVYVSGGKP